MSTLPVLPKLPNEVVLILSISQSVLFTDFSLRGNLPVVFQRVFGIDYAPCKVVDNGSVKWDSSDKNPFNRLLSPELSPEAVAQKFITTTARTARQLVRTAQTVSSPSRWRKSHFKQDLLEDLNMYWDAYENHVTTMNTFVNVESLLTNSLIDGLTSIGLREEVELGIPNFAVPSEPNWFVTDQQNLATLKKRFGVQSDNNEILDAISNYIDVFGFLFTPFHSNTIPQSKDVIERMKTLSVATRPNIKSYDNLPKELIRLGELERELTFWKTERMDAFALADSYVASMYKTLSEIIKLPLDLMFCMTRNELTMAFIDECKVSLEILKQRQEKYCMALIDGSIDFYQPTETKKVLNTAKKGDVIQGMPTSPGVVRGRVRLLEMGEDNPVLAPDEIIVTKMTRPELGAALDVALAYVTNEGGRLCHAAIVSREKKKPCVVACGNITELVRPNMLIEVNGSVGTVTIINDCSE